jgi:hypothetical protein
MHVALIYASRASARLDTQVVREHMLLVDFSRPTLGKFHSILITAIFKSVGTDLPTSILHIIEEYEKMRSYSIL